MTASTKKGTPKKRGRPATGKDPAVTVRLPAAVIGELADWAHAHDISRSEGLRRLLELGLSVSTSPRIRSPKAQAKASELAAQVIDRQLDRSATPEQRQSRKRRLLKGPKEFRDLRKDHK